MREGTPGRHKPLLCRHELPRFARQTEPPLCRPSLCYADRVYTLCSERAFAMAHKAQLL